MSARGYKEGRWSDLPQFACERCGWSVADKDAEKAEAVIRRHIAGHLGLPAEAIIDSGEGAEEEAELDFASDEAAEHFINLPDEERERVAVHLLGQKPGGINGFTVAEVREAAEAVNQEE